MAIVCFAIRAILFFIAAGMLFTGLGAGTSIGAGIGAGIGSTPLVSLDRRRSARGELFSSRGIGKLLSKSEHSGYTSGGGFCYVHGSVVARQVIEVINMDRVGIK